MASKTSARGFRLSPEAESNLKAFAAAGHWNENQALNLVLEGKVKFEKESIMYEMMTGPFIGMKVPEGHTFIAHLKFDELDEDMQERVRNHQADHSELTLEEAVTEYETSWESREVEHA